MSKGRQVDAADDRIARLTSIAIAVAAAMIALRLPSMLDAFRFKLELMSGLGLIAVLRWFWWRINGVTELATILTSVFVALALNLHPTFGVSGAGPPRRLLIVVICSGVVTIACALLTRPEPKDKLLSFYERVRPPRTLGRAIAAESVASSNTPAPITSGTIGQYAVCVGLVFSGMFAIGKLVLAEWGAGRSPRLPETRVD